MYTNISRDISVHLGILGTLLGKHIISQVQHIITLGRVPNRSNTGSIQINDAYGVGYDGHLCCYRGISPTFPYK